MIILDTDTFSLAQRESKSRPQVLTERILARKDEGLCVTVISFEEQTRGWLGYLAKGKSEDQKILAYLRLVEMLAEFAKLRVLPYDKEASFHYQRLVKSKIRVGTMDLRIAAIALAHSATLITRNRRDFEKIVGLKFEDWTKD